MIDTDKQKALFMRRLVGRIEENERQIDKYLHGYHEADRARYALEEARVWLNELTNKLEPNSK